MVQKEKLHIAESTMAVVIESTRRSAELPVEQTRVRGWGNFPVVSLVSALGLLAVAIALTGARAELWWATPLFWLSITVVVLPGLLLLINRDASRGERLGVVIALGIELYLCKILYSPVIFTFFDELQHYRTASDILATGRLFHENPILTVSPLFPGLEIVTHALASVSGLNIYFSGVLVLGVARLMLVLALFLLFELVSKSARIAGLSTFFYMVNPHFVLFDAQFGYESLAIPLLAVVLFLIAYRDTIPGKSGWAVMVMAIWCICMVIMTHHITSYLMALLLVVWVIVRHGPWPVERMTRSPFWLLVPALIGIAFWTIVVASPVVGYIAPNVTRAVRELMRLILREQEARQLFHSGSGPVAPWWSRAIGFGSTGLILLGFPFGAWHVWKHYRRNVLVLVLTLIAASYPLTLAARFTESGLLVASRTAPYVFLGVAFLLAMAVVQCEAYTWLGRLREPIALGWALAIFLGVLFTGLLAWNLPGPYLANSYTRSVDGQSVLLASWMQHRLGPDRRTAADNPNMLVVASFGEQHAVTADADNVWVNTLFDGSALSDDEYGILRGGKLEYVVYDTRISDAATTVPAAGSGEVATPFDSSDGANRVSDSGDIRVYDVRDLSRAK